MTLISDITAALIAGGFGTAFGTDIFAYQFPVSPLNCVAIIPLAGQEPLRYDASGSIDYPGLQIQARNTSIKTAGEKAEAIRQALDLATIGGYVVCRTTRSQPSNVTSPEDLQTGGGPVYRFSVDFVLTKVR
ncbi:minor capsid protein [Candidatus Pacearchaeota archaeon]|jgi:hypothetical protein|nr:minor capsid protein [Candidatus Pacearchaeota archaeon]